MTRTRLTYALSLLLVASSLALAGSWTSHPTTRALTYELRAGPDPFFFDVYEVDYDLDGEADEEIGLPVGSNPSLKAALDATLSAGTIPLETADPPPIWWFPMLDGPKQAR